MQMRFLKPVLYVLLALGLMAVSIFTYKTYHLLLKPMFETGEPLMIEVKPNSTANALIETLLEKKLISSKHLFLSLIKFEGLAHRLKAGTYKVDPGESAMDFIHRVVAGDVIFLAFRIIDGTTFTQVVDNLKKAPFLSYKETDNSVIQKINASVEGLLLADTYNYSAGGRSDIILKLANKKLLDYLETSWQSRSSGLPYKSSYEMLIAASILEKETAKPLERQLISGVIVNRLQKHMPLQMDPTVIYALGVSYTGKLSHNDLAVDSPYNTYKYRGLPPTPISMVGKLSIDAAAHPQKSDYLYFVAKGDGYHEFSKTYAEQKNAISHYLMKGNQ